MNKKAQKSALGFGLLVVAFILMIVAFITIEPFKENLNVARNTTSLNCPGTQSFNQTLFDMDSNSTINKLTRRPTCFVTGISMVYFIGAFLIGLCVWVVANWRKI